VTSSQENLPLSDTFNFGEAYMRQKQMKFADFGFRLARCAWITTLIALPAHQACKPSGDNESGVQHGFGNTMVPRQDFFPCKEIPAAPGYSETVRYLNNLKDVITRANPKTFQGDLAPENICIELDTSDRGAGGGAYGDSGRIMIERLAVKEAGSDAQLGGLLCHELAHVSMYHMRTSRSSRNGEFLNFTHGIGPDRYFQQLQQYPNYRSEKQALDLLNRRLAEVEREYVTTQAQFPQLAEIALPKDILESAKKDEVGAKAAMDYLAKCTTEACQRLKVSNDKVSALGNEKNELHNNKIPLQEYRVYQVAGAILPPEIMLTWLEREADEVGLELCARAGFDTRKLLSHRERRLLGTGSDYAMQRFNECRVAIGKALANVSSAKDPYGRVVEIPISDAKFPGPHPEECWRLFNLERELQLHAKEFQPFQRNLTTVVPGGLERAKSELSSTSQR
jgi:predicted SprT family Zn-dependent metalloprotease